MKISANQSPSRVRSVWLVASCLFLQASPKLAPHTGSHRPDQSYQHNAQAANMRASALDRESNLRERAPMVLGNQPLVFEANIGQVDPRVKFVARGGDGYSPSLCAAEAVMRLRIADVKARNAESLVASGDFPDPQSATMQRDVPVRESRVTIANEYSVSRIRGFTSSQV